LSGTLNLGVAGLGRAFMLMLPTLVRHSRLRLVAAADPRQDARDRFARDFGARSHPSVEALCADPDVDAIYVATPHGLHVDHVRCAAAHGRHVLVEKPMALTLTDCRAMVEAACAAGIHLLVGHSHSFDLPYLRTREIIDTGSLGAVRMITAVNFTDYLYRPRRPEELDTAQGGGALFSQAPHQVEVVRLLAGGRAASIRCMSSVWDPKRGTEGAYTALLSFEDGAAASRTSCSAGSANSASNETPTATAKHGDGSPRCTPRERRRPSRNGVLMAAPCGRPRCATPRPRRPTTISAW